MVALDHRIEIELHVVAEIVETELVVRAVGDVAAIRFLPLAIAVMVLDDADGEAEELVEAAHPFGVAAGEVIVHGDDVDAAAGECVQINGERRDERLALAGLHLGDLSAVQHHAAHQLNVEMAHVEHALAALTSNRKRLGQHVVQRGLQVFLRGANRDFVARNFFLCSVERFDCRTQTLAELGGFLPELVVGQPADFRLQCIDLLHDRQHPFHIALVFRAENQSECFIDHLGVLERARFMPCGTPQASEAAAG